MLLENVNCDLKEQWPSMVQLITMLVDCCHKLLQIITANAFQMAVGACIVLMVQKCISMHFVVPETGHGNLGFQQGHTLLQQIEMICWIDTNALVSLHNVEDLENVALFEPGLEGIDCQLKVVHLLQFFVSVEVVLRSIF